MKLYWRYKKDGKWTWKRVQVRMIRDIDAKYQQVNLVKLE